MTENQTAHVRALILDATPLITQSYTHYQNYAQSFYTTPTVFQEIKDAQARKNLEIWQSLGTLKLVHPSENSIAKVSTFAKLTGDYSVLSANDLHILALTYELEIKLNNGDWRLRKKPGDALDASKADVGTDGKQKLTEDNKKEEDSESVPKKKNKRRGGKKQKAKREAREAREAENANLELESKAEEHVEEAGSKEQICNDENIKESSDLNEVFEDADDDGDWITPENLTEAIIKDSGEDTTGSLGVEASEEDRHVALNRPENQVALATGDFAVQNVALQMNLNLMNFMSGLKIKRIRNYMLRCHACFKIFPLPKDGKPKHFCASCGGQGTLLRCAVSVDSRTGNVTPHLKSNFQWNNRGNRYSVASPLSKNSQKRYGKKGHVHSKPQENVILREDQKEYEKVIKQEEWTRRHNEKILNNWIGGGSADNYISPFAITGLKQHNVRIGKGRYVNSSKRRS
ncbi:AQG_2a_G0050190.mRNA.1.CDS.1 [Saccharomyces cerevisiae]|jgi:RNA-binding protein NOB1|uniref:20S-pre-rRNA D-site endonuclease NOB1 n=6 Tax=Saccharomyces TaxID=4930 RepID=NOB1_YEAST|nr:rRNA-binding endoribonuclease [Saccharomyces cerevisiae S288C]Q08444.1 RecName: Full=20S-pre-rRNA D-site endonuclease NOB1; AltName: Full=NIN1-binding protein; AltName: Full=Pre-rRNA-processing endonuclease NOB1 [Saccharomyces cerevisiae S288C]8C01_o Chain o, 20S-pre-rRNA D-site endonuclease NOB1 [Saccharomyces cerevisiae]8CBJ_a Chain a, 20S-pre-rRNA D-site endonuclease NOB1 [Saccharomyces cerevisiae W303]AHY77357.1 Nob1p [Saccharomyces cerevisiae YJM993]AJP41587.1 Nob1p [Saccharomyces cere|eukprot:NP_014699.1 rRNA-binding endoribonuclease [Saccharomyces cerevisiae S288C]